RRQIALNRYVEFTNECIHVLGEIRPRLEALNQQLISPDQTPAFQISDLLVRLRFLGSLRGVCVRPAEARDDAVNLRFLYEYCSRELYLLPAEHRNEVVRQRDELMYLVIELAGHCDTLEARSQRMGSRDESLMQEIMERLHRCEVIYYDFNASKERMRFILDKMVRTPPEALTEVFAVIGATRRIAKDIREDRAEALPVDTLLLQRALGMMRQVKPSRVQALKRLGLYNRLGEPTIIDHLEEYGVQILHRTREYLEGKPASQFYRPYPLHYYAYNERILSLYNHESYGIMAYYNQMADVSAFIIPRQVEETPWFMVLERPELVLPPPLAEEPVREIPLAAAPVNVLADVPANHLVFLLDVSASMNKPEKLPLFKQALAELLTLMRPEDHITLITYSGSAQVALEDVSARYADSILTAINQLNTTGETDIRKGIREAYRMATMHYIPGGNNRVILSSDGAFGIDGDLTRLVKRLPENNIPMSILLLSKFATERTTAQLSELAAMGGGRFYRFNAENAREILIREAGAEKGE
ncbi:MAG: VWA domain-containing protein, partial [Bacteroidetes bacterium]